MATKSTKVKLTLKITSFILRMLMNIIFYILVVLLIINVSKMAYEFTYQLYGPDTFDEAPGRDIPFQIKKGESTMDIASKLELNLAIKNKYSFYLKTKFQGLTIMPGTYIINTSMTYEEILAVITDYSASIIKEEVPASDAKTGSEAETSTESDTKTSTESDTKTSTETDNATK